MDPMDSVSQERNRTDSTEPGVGPVVRRVMPGSSPAAGVGSVGTSSKLTASGLAAGMRLREEERALVDAVLPEITNREREVLFQIVAGGTNEQVAERMGVKLPTLRTHLMRLNQKLGSTSKSDLVRLVTQVVVLEYRTRLFGTNEPLMHEGQRA